MSDFKLILPTEFKGNPFTMIGREWFLLTAGTPEAYNTMTCSWGFMGVIWNKPSVSVVVRQSRYTLEFMKKTERFTISFFDETMRSALSYCGAHSGRDVDKAAQTGLTPCAFGQEQNAPGFAEAKLVLVCKPRFTALMTRTELDPAVAKEFYADNDLHQQFIGEIMEIYSK